MTQGKIYIPMRGIMAVETKIVLERLALMQPGETVTYEELDKITGCNVRKRSYVMRTPIKKLLTDSGKVFVAERSVGLRLVRNSEIPQLSNKDITRIRHIAQRSIRHLAAVKFEELSVEEKVRHNTNMTLLAMFQRVTTPNSVKVIEESVKRQSNPLPITETLKLFGQ